MRLRLLAAKTLLAGSLFAADPGLVSLAMPDSQAMAGVNFEQVMLSPLGQYLLAQKPSDAGFEMLMEKAGFDARRDLREMLVAFNGQPGSRGTVVFLVRGTFDVPRILEAGRADGATIETYKGVSLIQKTKQESTAFPDSTLAIVGGAADVRAAIDRMSAPAAISSALAVQVNQLSTTEDVWFVSMASLSQLQPQAPATAGAGANPFAMLGSVQQFSGGVKFGANVMLSLQAVSQTDQDAATLAAVLKSFASGSDLFIKDVYTPAASLLKNLNATAEGPVTTISLSVPEPLIEGMIQASHANETHSANAAQPKMRHAQPPADGSANQVEQSAPAPTPQRIRVGGNVQERKLLQHPEPVIPPLALQARISGVVRLNAIIGKDGTVQNLTVTSGHPLLVPAALEAVKQWVYAPTLLNGQAVEVVTQIDVNFALSQ
jgi:TonB family protein